MSKGTRIWVILAVIIILIGAALFGGIMTMLKWDFSKLSTIKYKESTHTVTESYRNISIVTDTADIQIVPSTDSNTGIYCYEQESASHSVSVIEDTLTITINRNLYGHFGINLGSEKMTVYLPAGEYDKLSIESSTSNIEIADAFTFENVDIASTTGIVNCGAAIGDRCHIEVTTGAIALSKVSVGNLALIVTTGRITADQVQCSADMDVSVTTGTVKLSNVECQNLISSGTTGDIVIDHVIVADTIDISRTTGDIRFAACDAGELYLTTTTGDISGSLLTDKAFTAETTTGTVSIPHGTTGGKCEITTTTGDIQISIK